MCQKSANLQEGQLLSWKPFLLFFVPLALNTQLMALSHSVLNGILARSTGAVTALAAITVALTVHRLLAAPIYNNQALVLGLLSSRKAIPVFLVKIGAITAVCSFLIYLCSTDLFAGHVKSFFNLDDEVSLAIQHAMQVFTLLPWCLSLRGVLQGLQMVKGRTWILPAATLLRYCGMVALGLCLLPYSSGAQLGALILVAAVCLECIILALPGGQRISEQKSSERSLCRQLKFSLPLMGTLVFQQIGALLLLAIIGQLPDPTVNLAVFGLVKGVLFLFAAPVSYLSHSVQSLTRPGEAPSIIYRYGVVSSSIFCLMVLLSWGVFPLSLLKLDPTALSSFSQCLLLAAVAPLLHGLVNLQRGVFARDHQTWPVLLCAGIKLGFFIWIFKSQLLVSFAYSGVVITLVVLLLGELLDAILLSGFRLTCKGQPSHSRLVEMAPEKI